jgi:hypothetical protein
VGAEVKTSLLACAVSLAASVTAVSGARLPATCQTDAAAPAAFADYPAAESFMGMPAAPQVSGADARRYRTVIREKAAVGPNFAGHYTIANWGCGSTCIGFAVVDAKTGKVAFHPNVSRVMQVPYQAENVLQFRPDSRLLVIAGETEGPDGTVSIGRSFYEWKDERFTLVGKSDVRLEPGAPHLPPGTELDDLCSDIENSLECAREIEQYQLKRVENAHCVHRSGGELVLELRDGRPLAVKDDARDDDGASEVRYSFRDYFPKIGYYLVHRQAYEGADYLMIHDATGTRYVLQQLPVISPDGERLVTASDGLSGGYSANAVQIWRVHDDRLELEHTFEPEGWAPADAQWIDDGTIRVTKLGKDSFATLKREDDWKLQ